MSRNSLIIVGKISLALFGFLNGNTLDHQHQHWPAHLAGNRILGERWKLKSTCLQPLVVKNKSALFPSQQLDLILSAANKYEYLAGS